MDYEYQYTHGRRYHSNTSAAYGLPNDEKEQDRLDRQHRIFLTALDGRLYLAPLPVEKLGNVLDVGCGTGRWCIDLAYQAPVALVEGFDIRCVCTRARTQIRCGCCCFIDTRSNCFLALYR